MLMGSEIWNKYAIKTIFSFSTFLYGLAYNNYVYIKKIYK